MIHNYFKYNLRVMLSSPYLVAFFAKTETGDRRNYGFYTGTTDNVRGELQNIIRINVPAVLLRYSWEISFHIEYKAGATLTSLKILLGKMKSSVHSSSHPVILLFFTDFFDYHGKL